MKIVPGAHPDIFSLTSELLKRTPYTNELTLVDDRNNSVKFNKPGKTLSAEFHSGANLTLTLPSDYVYYHIVVHDGAIITAADLDFIAKWKKTETLRIIGVGKVSNFNVALPLLERINQLKTMRRLREFKVSVYSNAYKGFVVKPFMKRFPLLKLIILDGSSLTRVELEEMAQNQEVPGYWDVSVDDQQVIIYGNTDSDDSSDSSDWVYGGYH